MKSKKLLCVFVILFAVTICGCSYAEQKAIIKSGNVNVRSEPTTSSKRVDRLMMGSTVNILKNEDGDWCFIETLKGKKGWVMKKYLTFMASSEDIAAFMKLCSEGTPEAIEAKIAEFRTLDAKRGDKRHKLVTQYLSYIDDEGRSALSCAAENDNASEIADLLVNAGASVPKSLTAAIKANNSKAIVSLFRAFPDEVLKGDNFIVLCRYAPYEVIEAALKKGARINGYGRPQVFPLYVAAEYNPDPKVIELLLTYGAENNDSLVLGRAAIGGNIPVIDAVLKSGVKLASCDNSPLLQVANTTYAAPELLARALEGMKALIRAGADVNVMDSKRTPPIVYVAANGYTDMAAMLVENGAYLESADAQKNTPLVCAANNGHIDIVKLLIEAGADVNKISGRYSTTALIVAAEHGYVDMMKLLIEAGADINKQTAGFNDITAIVAAVGARNNAAEMLSVLLEAGADVNIKTRDGKRAIDFARNNASLAGTEPFLRLVKASR